MDNNAKVCQDCGAQFNSQEELDQHNMQAGHGQQEDQQDINGQHHNQDMSDQGKTPDRPDDEENNTM